MAKQKPRLGRGLSGLISGGRSNPPTSKTSAAPAATATSPRKKAPARPPQAAPVPDTGMAEIPLEQIRPNPRQPRREMADELIAELADSIRAEGLLQPIVVRTAGKEYEIIAGERRFRAYQKLGRTRIPARIMSVSDASSAALALIENLQREGLNPIEEALGYASLMRDFDLTQEEAAERVGRKRATLANAIRLLQLPKTIQGYLTGGLLTVGHAKVLLAVPEPVEQEKLAREVLESGWSVRQLEAAISRRPALARKNPGTKSSPAATDWMEPLARRLTSDLQARVSVRQRGRRTQLTIEVHGREELDRILQRLQVDL